jgi:hypothetical protein
VPLPDSQPLFSTSAMDWVMYPKLWLFIRKLAQKAGLDPSLYGCHSARSGGPPLPPSLGPRMFMSSSKGCGNLRPISATCTPPSMVVGPSRGRWPTPPVVTPSYAEGFFYWVFGFVLSASVCYWFSTLAWVFLL